MSNKDPFNKPIGRDQPQKLYPIVPQSIRIAEIFDISIPIPEPYLKVFRHNSAPLANGQKNITVQISGQQNSDKNYQGHEWWINSENCSLKKKGQENTNNNINYFWTCQAYAQTNTNYFPSLTIKVENNAPSGQTFITPQMAVKVSSNFASPQEHANWKLQMESQFLWPWQYFLFFAAYLLIFIILIIFRKSFLKLTFSLLELTKKTRILSRTEKTDWTQICEKTFKRMIQNPEKSGTEYLVLLQRFQKEVLETDSDQIILSNLVSTLKSKWDQKFLSTRPKDQAYHHQLIQDWANQSQTILFDARPVSVEVMKEILFKTKALLPLFLNKSITKTLKSSAEK